ncbi:MAG: hypothetical protein JXA91_03645 [Candidatus Thermoplasmatota archaeon]|nr:hypothetical protein [Candidatus Thermoplasmatota archaeon]
MKIRNIELKSIEARRYIGRNERPKQVRIDHNSTVSNFSDVGEKQATIDFQYTASYGPVGVIKIEGSLIFEDSDATKIAGDWKKSRKMPDQIASGIHTAIMHACVPEAVGIAKDLALPPPIPLPQVRIGENVKKAQFGPEVA